MSYKVVDFDEEEHNRFELREYPNRWEAVQLRRLAPEYSVLGDNEWFVRNIVTITKDVPQPDKVTVNLEDLRLLITEASEFLVTNENRNAPVVGAIDRMGDQVCIVTMRNGLEARRAKD